MQVETLKTKAAKAAEIAIKLTNEKQQEKDDPKPSPLKQPLAPQGVSADSQKTIKDLEKKVTKLRNEN